MKISKWSLISVLVFIPDIGYTYIGPGLGTGIIAGVLGVAVGIICLIIGLIWYPIKSIAKYMRNKKR